MLTNSTAKSELLALLRKKSVFYGDFVLSSGARSSFYFDCKLTTLDPEGAWLVGQVMHSIVRAEAVSRNVKINSVGGLTMGADPISLAVGMYSAQIKEKPPLQTFIVRKTPKNHGQAKLIEGNFKPGDLVVVFDDVVTKGESTIAAINAVVNEGGKVAFVAVLVDRQEGGRQRIEDLGYSVISAFRREDIVQGDAKPTQPPDFVAA